MFRIDNASASRTLTPPTPPVTEAPTPTPPGGVPVGDGGRFWTDGVNTQKAPTLIQSEWLNMIQEELCQVVETTSVLLEKDPTLHRNGPYSQLATAFRILCDADDTGGGPSPPTGAGSSIEEPPADGLAYDRNRAPPSPDENADGYWTRAIDEPPDDGYPYNRFVTPGQIVVPPARPVGDWKQSSGQDRIATGATFNVAKGGSDAIGDGSTGRPWRTIQHAVDMVTRNVDANGRIVTIKVGPHNAGIGNTDPWEGFRVRRPLIGAKPDGFKIIGDVASPELCELGQIPKVGGPAGAYERFSVYVNNAKIAVSGFTFIAQDRQNIFMRADENGAEITLEGGIIFKPMFIPSALEPADPTRQTFAHMSAVRGATINLKGTVINRGADAARPNGGFDRSAGRSTIHGDSAGKFLFSPGVIMYYDRGGAGNYNSPGPSNELLLRSICDLGYTGLVTVWPGPPVTPYAASIQSYGRMGIVSFGNAYQGGLRANNITGMSSFANCNPTLNPPAPPGNPGGANTYWSHESMSHTGTAAAGGIIGANPAGNPPDYFWAPPASAVP
jgi:hypothetical protein